jgi:ABC-type dipeptide/oligopeptide/nickel transport system permease subunit
MGAIIAHQTIPFRYSRTGAFPPGLPPGIKNILGTDSLGRGIDVQLAEAVVNSVQIGLIAALIGTLVGAVIGFTNHCSS